MAKSVSDIRIEKLEERIESLREEMRAAERAQSVALDELETLRIAENEAMDALQARIDVLEAIIARLGVDYLESAIDMAAQMSLPEYAAEKFVNTMPLGRM